MALASPSAPVAHHGSVWPLVVTLASVLLLLAVLVPPLALVGVAALAIGVAGWVREDARELAGSPTPAGRGDYWLSVLLFLASEAVVFGVLFTYWFWARARSAAWAVHELDLALVTANTAMLVASGFFAHAAESALRRGNEPRFRRFLVAAIALGVVFLAGQAFEYATLDFAPASGPYGSAFFALTGVHGLHVLGGLVALGAILALSAKGRMPRERAGGVGGAVLYWHFVDAVWIVLYLVLYVGVL